MNELVLIDITDGVAQLTLNRPEKLNAYSFALHHALYDAIDQADNNPAVRAIVVTGAGRAFCAGADLEDGFGSLGKDSGPPEIEGIARDYGGMLNLRIFETDTPILAAVNGHAVGIGATMLLPMDITICSERSKFAFPFARRGIVFDGGASWFLPRVVGLKRAQRWITTGETFTAPLALEAGMVSEVVPPEDVLSRTLEIAKDIASNVAPQSAALNKQLLRDAMLGDGPFSDNYNGPMAAHIRESDALAKRFVSDDCKEGVMAFLEKRSPNFSDNA